jgi:hypothetical protein
MKLLVVSSIILFLASSVYPQQKPPTDSKPTQNIQQTLVAQAKMIAALAQQVSELERRIQILEQNEQHRSQVDSSTLSRPDFSAVKVALANYHQACLAEHDRAAAAALAQNPPALTYMGAAAMGCAEKVKVILDQVVDILDKQR